ncbi:acyl-CoA thioesterase [Nocardia brasiliensis]|uniref:acyl-CoA thioesterase n=1 Tax=Nocardia brasiliensis TaxID=37326 RepID=UPI000E012209|nr:acyl-CoA thioesterase [Nocardia brasiliensis]SUB47769.1 bifunctional 3-hydroxyacyl-CoA dehydrogenase/thioesterase [Nocardia brasiliensis]
MTETDTPATASPQTRSSDATGTTQFTLRFAVRSYELDTNHHLASTVYLQYAEHTRFACGQAAGLSPQRLLADGLGPINLETTVRHHAELRADDTVDVTCVFVWGPGKTHRVEHTLTKPDGTLVAEVHSVSGLLDMRTRRMVADPARELRSRATDPALLGLA